jgi:death on curing protein
MSIVWIHPTAAAAEVIFEEVLAAEIEHLKPQHVGKADTGMRSEDERFLDEMWEAHGGPGLRAKDLLESALAAPQASMGGQPLMTDGCEIAAAYLFYICRNRPFIDGNKRTALATCLVFMKHNGLLEDEALDTDAWESLVLDVAASRIDRRETTKRLRKLVKR